MDVVGGIDVAGAVHVGVVVDVGVVDVVGVPDLDDVADGVGFVVGGYKRVAVRIIVVVDVAGIVVVVVVVDIVGVGVVVVCVVVAACCLLLRVRGCLGCSRPFLAVPLFVLLFVMVLCALPSSFLSL